MKLTFKNDKILVERLDSPKMYRDSTLMCHIKRELQKLNYDVISKDLSKEAGNMLSNGCYGIIARDRSFQIYHNTYCIYPAYQAYNTNGLTLTITVWCIMPKCQVCGKPVNTKKHNVYYHDDRGVKRYEHYECSEFYAMDHPLEAISWHLQPIHLKLKP